LHESANRQVVGDVCVNVVAAVQTYTWRVMIGCMIACQFALVDGRFCTKQMNVAKQAYG